jgi:hypothetical protein
MIENPIFIIGTERSGSNLLRLILNSHSNITIPHPPHLMRDFQHLEMLYGDLNNEANFNNLLNDCIRFVNAHFAPWPYSVKKEDLQNFIEIKSLYGIYVALYEQFLKSKNKKRWGCKSTFMWQEIEKIVQTHAEPKFIHLVRDPRDVAVSAKRSIFSKSHPYNLASLWNHEQAEIEKYKLKKLNDKNYLLVKYEDLTSSPQQSVEKIMNFLNENLEEQQFEFFKTKEASELALQSKSWENVQRPIETKSIGQFNNSLSEKEIRYIESVCHELMKKYEYKLNHPESLWPITGFEWMKINLEEKLLYLKNEIISSFTDKNFTKRWQKKILLKQIEWRYSSEG